LLWPRGKQIDEGRQSELTGLQAAIPTVIAARQWPQAEANIARFEQLAPGDSRAAEWRKQVDAGRALDALRSSIQTAIRQKDWATAEVGIASLLAKAPDDPQAPIWQAQIAQARKADLPVKKGSKQAEDHQAELAQAEQLLQQGDYQAAIDLFQRVLTQDRGNARARSGLKKAKDAKAIEDSVFSGGH
jgi:Flp pilus assembly protein TadD